MTVSLPSMPRRRTERPVGEDEGIRCPRVSGDGYRRGGGGPLVRGDDNGTGGLTGTEHRRHLAAYLCADLAGGAQEVRPGDRHRLAGLTPRRCQGREGGRAGLRQRRRGGGGRHPTLSGTSARYAARCRGGRRPRGSRGRCRLTVGSTGLRQRRRGGRGRHSAMSGSSAHRAAGYCAARGPGGSDGRCRLTVRLSVTTVRGTDQGSHQYD